MSEPCPPRRGATAVLGPEYPCGHPRTEQNTKRQYYTARCRECYRQYHREYQRRLREQWRAGAYAA